jgi:Cu-processing system permease protein
MFELIRLYRISLKNLLLARWIWGYFAFFLIISFGLFRYSPTLSGAMVSYMNVVVLVIPLIATIIGSMYYYNNYDFSMMMLTQPIKRMSVFLGQLWALISMLSLSFLVGTIGGAAYFGFDDILWTQLIILMICGVFLNAIFTSMAFVLAVKMTDKVKGIGSALFIWLFMAIVYDGLLLAYFYAFGQYPVENHAIIFSLINPIDLSRVVVMLQMDVAALMGYTGAVFKAFFGNSLGLSISLMALIFWVAILQLFLWVIVRRKDF